MTKLTFSTIPSIPVMDEIPKIPEQSKLASQMGQYSMSIVWPTKHNPYFKKKKMRYIDPMQKKLS